MKKFAVSLSLAMLLAVSANSALAKDAKPAQAQKPAAAAKAEKIDPARLEAARKLIRTTTSDRLIDQVLNMATSQVTMLMIRMKPEKKKEITEIMHKIASEMKSSRRKQELYEKIARIYARHFTVDEMNKLIAFYETPVGRKFIQKMPEVMLESQKAGMEWGRAVAQEMFRRAREEAKKKGIEL